MENNGISNVFTVHSNVGYIATLLLNLALLLLTTNNPKLDNYVLVLTGYLVVRTQHDDWMEGDEHLARSSLEIDSREHRVRATLKTYKHLLYSYVLFGCLPLEPYLTSSWTGAEYHRNSRYHLPAQQATTSTMSAAESLILQFLDHTQLILLTVVLAQISCLRKASSKLFAMKISSLKTVLIQYRKVDSFIPLSPSASLLTSTKIPTAALENVLDRKLFSNNLFALSLSIVFYGY
ncbi:uncharacterized protein F5891DRAFT_983771 [Suillus fuscotomentosus]|uniref:Uncharacterized protein n=1 Tax=Suillus fuscotomentosus TaxID=1912939 RepID=A0AAD4DYN5_9AGAM|nr:uncharacterized protein F5891DRAFT_983771 [Suillus fuscotomentosus]KAG1896072.1 hypothetical protein F5891DRAFT_983771 [Suillus fuscotomentosus]